MNVGSMSSMHTEGQLQKMPPIDEKGGAINSRVAVVVLNYNCFEDVRRCIDSLGMQTYQNFVLILVDNASPDHSGAQLRSLYERHGKNLSVTEAKSVDHGASQTFDCHFIQSPENLGFAAGNNLGIRYALTLDVDYIWLLNPDTECEPSALHTLLAEIDAKPNLAAVGSKILYGGVAEQLPENRRIWGCGGLINFHSHEVSMRGAGELDNGQYDAMTMCDYLPGCSLLARAQVFQEIGLLPEQYFMYFEETDWCQRLTKAGHTMKFVPGSVVLHHFSDAKMQGASTVYYYNRNQRLFWLRHGSVRKRMMLYWNIFFRELPQVYRAYQAAKSTPQQELFKAHWRSAVDALLFRGGKRW